MSFDNREDEGNVIMKTSNGAYHSDRHSSESAQSTASHHSLFEHTTEQFHNFVDHTLRPDIVSLFEDIKRLFRAELDVVSGQAAGVKPLVVTAAIGCAAEIALLLFTVVFFGALLGSTLGSDSLSADTRMWALGVSIFLIVLNGVCIAWILSVFRRVSRSADQIFRS